MKKLIQTLTEALGPSGYEAEVREIVRTEIKPFADEIRVDSLGNLIACKQPRKTSKNNRKIMISAHLDEIGLIVSHVDRNGFVHFSPLGWVPKMYLPGSHVRFLNGTPGVVQCERSNNANELPPLDRYYVDVGATGRSNCPVKIGDVAVFDGPYRELGNHLMAKSMGSRAGVWVAVETLRSLKSAPQEVDFVFTVQQQVGGRGALTSAYGVAPDLGIAIDCASAGDAPRSHDTAIALGKGPCIRVQDGSMIADVRVVDWMIRLAEKSRIPYQREISSSAISGTGAIQSTRAGVLSGCLSIPVRYLHSSSEMVDISDVQNAVRLLTAILRSQIEL
ncbi:MAG TPA: M42 family metallopeptidase [Anaerolineales bacterium]|nr:M42 family metallopeptidase [Anaerolineales bacterium]